MEGQESEGNKSVGNSWRWLTTRRFAVIFFIAVFFSALYFVLFGMPGKYTLQAGTDYSIYAEGNTVTMAGSVKMDGTGVEGVGITITDSCGNDWTSASTDASGDFTSTRTAAFAGDGLCDVDVDAQPDSTPLHVDLGYSVYKMGGPSEGSQSGNPVEPTGVPKKA